MFRQAGHAAAIVVAIVVISSLIIASFPPLSVSGQVSTTTTATGGYVTSLGANFIELRAFQQYGSWTAGSETPASVLATITSLRNAISGPSISILGFVKDIQINTESVGGGYTLDSYLLAVRAAAGGEIIPSLNLDIYTHDQGAGSPSSYCDPHNRADCGPHFFYETSAEFLSLSAISKSSHRTVFLDSWDTFARNSTAYPLAGQIFQNLTNQGWKQIVVKQIGPGYFAPPSSSWGQGSDIGNISSSPYMIPPVGNVCCISSMPSNQAHLAYFDRQNKAKLTTETSFQVFLSQLSPNQQAAALTNLAIQQSKGSYVFAFPIMSYTTYMGTTYRWDANTNRQSNGQPFLNLIEDLMLTYDGGGQSTSTTTSSSVSQSSTSSLATTSSTQSSSSTTSQFSSTTSKSSTSVTSSSTQKSSQNQQGSGISYSLEILGGCYPSGVGTYSAGSIINATSQGVCNRAGGSGVRISSWSIDGGPANPVSTLGNVTVPVSMDSSHVIVFNQVTQRQLLLDFGASQVLKSITAPSIQGDKYWYDSGKQVTYQGKASTTGVVVVGWSLDDGPLHPVDLNVFTVSVGNMTSTHVLHVTISTRSPNACSQTGSCNISQLSTVYMDTNSPDVLTLQVDGVNYPATVSFSWPTGSTHSISAPIGNASYNSRTRFIGWVGSLDSNNPVLSLTANGTMKLSLEYNVQYLIKFSFTDSAGNYIQPDQITLQGSGGNLQLPTNRTAWLNYGSKYLLTSAIWQGTDVATSGDAATLYADAPMRMIMALEVYPQTIKVEDALSLPLAGARVDISTVGGVVMSGVTDENGVASFDVPYGMYYASATFMGVSSTIWQGTMGSHSLTVTVLLSYPVLGGLIFLLVFPIVLIIRRRRNEVRAVRDMLFRTR